jgi:hypothetical protein
MALTAAENQVVGYLQGQGFVSHKKCTELAQGLAQKGDDLGWVSYVIGKDFYESTCPVCGQAGYYKWHTFGQLHCPACSQDWYINPGQYLSVCFKSTLRGGMDAAGEAMSDAERKGESKAMGCFTALFVGYFVAAFKAIFLLAGWVIQVILFAAWRFSGGEKES